MATAVAASYSGQSGQRVLGGRFPAGNGTLSGAAALDGASAGGSMSTAAPGGFDWSITDASTLSTGRNTTTQIATNLPAGAVAYASPDLLPGQRLVLDGTTLNLVGDATVPTVDGAAAGSAVDAISARGVVIEVIESPAIATIVNVTRGITYEWGANYTGRTGNQAVNRWNAVMAEANANDIIEVSPGAIQGPGGTTNYWNGIDSTILAIWKPITLRGMTGRGRWRLYPNRDFATQSPNGITIFAPNEIDSGRGAFTISDFEYDCWGNTSGSYGLRIRTNASAAAFSDYHSSLTVKNFKMGKPPFERSASGFDGSAETMLFENGHVYDCGAGLSAADGRDHNFYVSARSLTMRGVRCERTRGIRAEGWWEPGGSGFDMDGHLAKLSFIDGLIEGCAFVCGPRGDNSLAVQAKAGGNLVMRGCLVIGGRYTQNQGQGMVVMLREGGPSTPNYEVWWDAFRTGNSVLLERNLFISHFGKPILFFFAADQVSEGRMLAGSGADQIASVIVRDNIGMVNNAVTADAPFTSAKWIKNCPDTFQGAWNIRNTERVYSAGEFGFTDRELLLYGDALGAPAAWQGSQTVKQFLWPHHWRDVTRSTQGLG